MNLAGQTTREGCHILGAELSAVLHVFEPTLRFQAQSFQREKDPEEGCRLTVPAILRSS
jgi:hypothetical protein